MKLNDEQLEIATLFKRFFENELGGNYKINRREKPISVDLEFLEKLTSIGFFELFSSAESFPSIELGNLAYEAGRSLVDEPLCEFVLTGPLLSRLTKLDFNDSIIGIVVTDASLQNLEIKDGKVSLSATLLRAADHAKCFLIYSSKAKSPLFIEGKADYKSYNGIELSTPLYSIEFKDAEFKSVPETTVLLQCYRVSLALEMAGAASRSLELTLEYIKTRKQFGVTISSFQAVQHAASDMHVLVESMRSLGQFAAWSISNSPAQAELASLAALKFSVENAQKVCEKAIQLHGGIGFTWEHELHNYLRRINHLKTIGESFSDLNKNLIEVALTS